MDRYEKNKQIGQGTFGRVYDGKMKTTGQTVALKKIRMLNKEEGISFTALREIGLLQEIKHPNIVRLYEVFVHKGNPFLVFELMHTDLEVLIRDPQVAFSPSDIKSCMQMILKGVEHLHKHWVLHRDLKPNNILINKSGVLKLADFGLARPIGSPDQQLTSQVVTRWYRAPELLYGARAYGYGVDMWAVGCIFAELMLKRAYLPGDNDIDQLSRIFAALGTPTEAQWPGMTKLPDYIEFKPSPPSPFNLLFTAASPDALDLLGTTFRFDPNSRCTATEALASPYFHLPPGPTPPERLPMPLKLIPKSELIALNAAGQDGSKGAERKRPGAQPGFAQGDSFARRKLDL